MGAINTKSKIRYEQIALYRVRSIMTDGQIAALVGMTSPAFGRAVQTPEYIAIEDEVRLGRSAEITDELESEQEQLRRLTTAAVPAALQALVDSVSQRQDLRTALAAAKMIINFDPSRTLTEAGTLRPPSDGGDGSGPGGGGPQLPENVIAYLSVQGNMVVKQIQAKESTSPAVGSPSQVIKVEAAPQGHDGLVDSTASQITQATQPMQADA